MDLGRSFTYMMEDERWLTKLLIGGLVGFFGSFIVVGPFILSGYMYRIARNVAAGSTRPLPEWEDWGGLLVDGFKGTIISLVYALPALILMFLSICLFFSGAVTGDENAFATMGIAGFCLIGISLLVALVCVPFSLGGLVRYLQTNSLSDAFKFGEIIAFVRSNLNSFLMLILLAILFGFIYQVGSFLFYVGLIATMPYATMMFGHVLGQYLIQFNNGQNSSYSGYNPTQYQ